MARGEWQPPSVLAAEQAERNQTLQTFAATWLASRTNAKGDQLSPRTLEEYRRLLRGPLATLTALPLASLTPAVVRRWRAEQMETGHKTQTSRAYGLLSSILATAVGDGILATSPCTIRGGQSTHTGRKVVPPTDAELETILESIAPRFRALVLVAAVGGLRYGEATALRARDVTVERDESGAVVAVRLDVSRGVVATAAGFVVRKPKSEAGIRRVAIFGDDAEVIAQHVRTLIGDALLFPSRDGVGFLAQSTFTRYWYPARMVAGRADMPFHALRHYAGTRYAQTGATVRETMARLGHASLGAALRYQHSGSRDDELAARMSRRNTSA
ncbi:tyrosine-type recombinase/integrase [Glaciihabitans sp. INWT7]|uniref:tyrosine-type recombinase/integrase n=1 Tax=Glaciihabitans sp. INWT7 TaxID=2596912 RepID=UPI001CA5A491|nr:tyrosine-type recombinase/integrase [Glaciihabitans sp. INWT7]